MRLAEQDENQRIRMPAANLGDFVSGMAVTGRNSAQILARHTVEPVDRGAWSRAVTAARKMESSHIPNPDRSGCAGEVRLRQSHRATIRRGCAGRAKKSSRLRAQRGDPQNAAGSRSDGEIALRIRERMVVADQRDSRPTAISSRTGIQNPLVGAVGIAEIANILAPPAGSLARISRSTLAMAWSWAALRRDRKMPVVAIRSRPSVETRLAASQCRGLIEGPRHLHQTVHLPRS